MSLPHFITLKVAEMTMQGLYMPLIGVNPRHQDISIAPGRHSVSVSVPSQTTTAIGSPSSGCKTNACW